ncbi:hypothetical protein P4S72_07755 [Vibrio sp. PP-XX7]
MIPARFYQVHDIPLNHNGKVDRQALILDREHPVTSLAAEVSLMMRLILQPIGNYAISGVKCWASIVLSMMIISLEIGGHSLKANSALLRIRERLCPAMTLKDFFSHPHFLVRASFN